VPAPPFAGRVTFDRVSFGYRIDSVDGAGPGAAGTLRPALRDVSLEVEAGGVLAIVGYSGAGKSTLAQLLPRLYDPQSGAVRIDGTDIRRFTLESLRDQISLVLQDAVLFSGTVADNIAYGLREASGEAIVRAARLANAHEFIEQLPDGYATMLGERGANLSGGQRQRIAIARAFIRNPPILVLDEPTTGLDVESTHLVLDALATLMRGKTTIIVSHDLNLIRRADRVCVIDSGRIVEAGTHHELLRSGGRYADLHAKQFGPGSDEPTRPPADAGFGTARR
jgi:ABC-type multidrug transport system fused ATPase/permease subunit